MQTQVIRSLREVDASEWNSLIGKDDPFLAHAFLLALEQSDCVGSGTGWEPSHILCREENRLVGAVPLYLKENSYGEYIFDWGWAQAARRSGIRYYPKLLSAIPFTPASGNRLLLANDRDSLQITRALIKEIRTLSITQNASSIHFLFLSKEEQKLLAETFGFFARTTYQFHWTNNNWTDFTQYLASFRSSARKQIRKERRMAKELGLQLRTLRGTELQEKEWNALYLFYRSTISYKYAIPYLTKDFFQEIQKNFADHVVVALASKDGTPVAGALAFQKGKHLYGRYWGALGDYEMLHFELCYYQLIEYAIQNKLSRFEAGAQGQHKLKRGFLPSPTYSAHWLAHPALSQAIGDYLPKETLAVEQEIEYLSSCGPFHREHKE